MIARDVIDREHSERIPAGIYAAPSLTAANDGNLDDQAEAADCHQLLLSRMALHRCPQEWAHRKVVRQAAAQQALALPQVNLGQQPGNAVRPSHRLTHTVCLCQHVPWLLA